MTFYQENENIYISILILEPDFEKRVFSPDFQKVGGAKKAFPFSFSFSSSSSAFFELGI
jgi:hypothetical protein